MQPRVFTMTQQEATSSHDVISGRLTIFGESAYALINPGVTHLFIVSSFTSCIQGEKYDEPGFSYRYVSGLISSL